MSRLAFIGRPSGRATTKTASRARGRSRGRGTLDDVGSPSVASLVRLAPSGTALVQREAEAVGDELDPRKVDSDFTQRAYRLGPRGGALPLGVRRSMERRFGEDFTGVRVHEGPDATALAGSIGARAFTMGRDVFFRGGAFRPDTPGGERLLAHELTHVLQQGDGVAAVQRQVDELPTREGEGAGADPATNEEPEADAHPPDPELEAAASGDRFLRFGSRGEGVVKVQKALVAFGHRQQPPRDLLPSFGVDGIFGAETHRAVVAFQRVRGLAPDGIVGPDTIRALSAETIRELIVEDDAKGELPAGAMRKTEFVTSVADESCRTADAILVPSGFESRDCPGAELFANFIADKPAAEIVRLMAKARPALVFGANSAHELVNLVVSEVRRAVSRFVTTGEVTGIPDDIGIGREVIDAAMAGGAPPVRHKGARPTSSPSGTVVPRLLVGGRPLEGGVRSRMEGALGAGLGHVRVHTEPKAAAEVSKLGARAVSMGRDVAFAEGEYRPGTLIGDALLAHELAHTLQQSADALGKSTVPHAASDDSALEADADRAAVGVVARLWSGSTAWLRSFAGASMPRLKSGLRLTRCARPPGPLPPGPTPPSPVPPEPAPTPSLFDGSILVKFKDQSLDRSPHIQAAGAVLVTEFQVTGSGRVDESGSPRIGRFEYGLVQNVVSDRTEAHYEHGDLAAQVNGPLLDIGPGEAPPFIHGNAKPSTPSLGPLPGEQIFATFTDRPKFVTTVDSAIPALRADCGRLLLATSTTKFQVGIVSRDTETGALSELGVGDQSYELAVKQEFDWDKNTITGPATIPADVTLSLTPGTLVLAPPTANDRINDAASKDIRGGSCAKKP